MPSPTTNPKPADFSHYLNDLSIFRLEEQSEVETYLKSNGISNFDSLWQKLRDCSKNLLVKSETDLVCHVVKHSYSVQDQYRQWEEYHDTKEKIPLYC